MSASCDTCYALARTQELMCLPIKPNTCIQMCLPIKPNTGIQMWVTSCQVDYWLSFLNNMTYWGPLGAFALLLYFIKACTRITIVMLSWIDTVNYWNVIQVSSGKLKLLIAPCTWWEMRNHFFCVSGMIVGGLANISNTQKSIRCICYISYSFWLTK
jgi:hypothetical protein